MLKLSMTLVMFLGMQLLLSAQCFQDRHDTSVANSWLSCEVRPNPNADRGESHWIQYELGELRKLSQMHFWNLNNPETLDSGVKLLAIDYSLDGIDWVEWGTWPFEQASASGFYEGNEGPDLDGILAEYLLLTVIETHGGDCAGFSELRIDLQEVTTADDLESDDGFIALQPNPASVYTDLVINVSRGQTALMQLQDFTGKVISSEEVKIVSGMNKLRMELASVPSGEYLVRLLSPTLDATKELSIINIR